MLSRSNNPLISASRRWTVSTVASLLTAAGALGASATFYGVGQLPGGAPNSEIRDAVITATGVLAVGNAQANPSAALSDTAVLWTPTDGLQSLDGLLGISVPLEHSFMTASQIAATSHQVAARIVRAADAAQLAHAQTRRGPIEQRLRAGVVATLDRELGPGWAAADSARVASEVEACALALAFDV